MKRNLLAQLVLLIATLVLVCPLFSSPANSIPPINQNTIIVDIYGNGDYTSIKDAINAATATDIIKIKEGLYQENDIDISKKLTIVGEDPSSTIIDFMAGNGLILSSSHIDISGLKLINARAYVIDVGLQSDGCSISNCIVDKYGSGVGISIEASSVLVSNCNVSGYNSTAIGINLLKHDNIVKGCTVQGFDTGILIQLNAYSNKVLNCNLVDNQVAIDIRINSNKNTMSECNIYSNAQGAYIWQSSVGNLIYRNNFWKNDIDAVDESNNSWDNGVQGNYWDNYRGQDLNNDGIGDTPYVIKINYKDNYPIMNMILPDVITLPTNIKQTTIISDDTPSFTWTPSVYSKSIKGYFVKIDGDAETFIGDKTSWASNVKVSDGVHIFYVRAETIDNASSSYATLIFYIYTSINASLIDSDKDGLPDVEETQLGSNQNNPRDAKKIYPGGKPYFLVDVNQDGSFDVLYNPTTKNTTSIEKSGEGYLIDTNGDGDWEYVYNTTDGSISTYQEKVSTFDIWMIIIPTLILTIFVGISLIVWYYIKNIRIRSKYPRYEEYKKTEKKPVEKLPIIRKPVSTIPKNIGDDRRYTVEMMNETRILLQKIEQDFAEYAEKLHEMDEQIEGSYPKVEKEKIFQEPKKSEIKGMEDIESEVDKLLSELSKK